MGKQRGDGLTESEIHHVLSNKRRQFALIYLFENGGRAELGQLSEFIAEQETDESPPPRKKRNSVYSSLHQNHLPRLDSLDVLEYDESRKVIELGQNAADIRPHLQRKLFKSKVRSISYIGVGIIGVTIIAGSLLNVYPFSIFHPLSLVAGYFAIVAMLASIEFYNLKSRLTT